MSGLGQNRSKTEADVEIDLVPIMNMFLVLVPFLLMSAAFFQLKAINTSVPVLAETKREPVEEKQIKVTVIVRLREKGIHLSAVSDSLTYEELTKWDSQIAKEKKGGYPLNQLLLSLEKIKEDYPASDTLIVIPDENIIYDTIIQAMDVGRYAKNRPLFPNVVLSGKV